MTRKDKVSLWLAALRVIAVLAVLLLVLATNDPLLAERLLGALVDLALLRP